MVQQAIRRRPVCAFDPEKRRHSQRFEGVPFRVQ